MSGAEKWSVEENRAQVSSEIVRQLTKMLLEIKVITRVQAKAVEASLQSVDIIIPHSRHSCPATRWIGQHVIELAESLKQGFGE